MKTLNTIPLKKSSFRAKWLIVAWAIALLILFLLLARCGKDEKDKCGLEETNYTVRQAVTKTALANGGSGYDYSVSYEPGLLIGEPTKFRFVRTWDQDFCTADEFGMDLWTEASAWVHYTTWPINEFYVYGRFERPNGAAVQYTWVQTGAGVNTIHHYGTHDWIDLGEEEYGVSKSIMVVEFPGKGNFDSDASYLVDSLQVEVRFQAKYAKPN